MKPATKTCAACGQKKPRRYMKTVAGRATCAANPACAIEPFLVKAGYRAGAPGDNPWRWK